MSTALASPRSAIAQAILPHARAMTDVTGFGLAGHLSRMARASGLSASVALADLPLYSGAEDLAEQGVRSSLYDSNRADIVADIPDVARGRLLFDPQTAGGFLVAISEEDATRCLERLWDLGHQAARIGRFEPPSPVSVKAH